MASTSLMFNIIGRDQTKAAFGSAASGAKKLGGAVKLGLAGLGLGAGLAGVKTLVDAASDMNESLSKTGVVFGKAQDGVLKFSQTSAAQFGISKQAALEYASSMGSVLIAQGDSQDEAEKTSITYTKLAADMASFGNTSSADSSDALTASLTGEYEMLKKYGIVINDARLATEAQRVGMTKTGATWTAQQKKTLSYNLIMHDTAQAQGDFARTSSGYANSQRILQARIEDLRASMGAKLMPIAAKVLVLFSKGIDLSAKLGNALKPVGRAIGVFWTALSGGSEANEFSGKLRSVNNAGVSVGRWIREDFLPAAKRFGTWIKAEAIPAVVRFAGWLARTLGPAVKTVAKVIREDIAPAVARFIERLRESWPAISRVIKILGVLVGFVMTKVVPVVLRLYGKYLATLIRVFGATFAAVWRVIGALVSIGAAVGRAGRKIWDFATAVGGAAGKAKDAIVSKVGAAADWLKGFPGRAISAIGNLGSMLYQHGLDFIQGFINGIVDKAKDLPGIVKDKVVGVAKDALHGFGLFGSPSRLTMKYGRWWSEGFVTGLDQRVAAIKAAAKDKVMTPLQQAMQERSQAISDVVGKLIEKMKARFEAARDLARTIRATFVDAASITSLDSGDATGLPAMLAALRKQAAASEAFGKGITDLRKRGLNATTLKQLIDAGPSSLGQVEALLGGGTSGIASVNALAKRISRAGGDLGDREAVAQYGIDPSKPQKATIKAGSQKVHVSFDFSGAGDDALVKALRKAIRVKGGSVQVVLGS